MVGIVLAGELLGLAGLGVLDEAFVLSIIFLVFVLILVVDLSLKLEEGASFILASTALAAVALCRSVQCVPMQQTGPTRRT